MDKVLIVGLGNPGTKFKYTRHNAGFLALDYLREKWGLGDFKGEERFLAQISQGDVEGKKIILAKPQSFMNNSGVSVKSLIKNLKLKIKNLIVVHDDSDLAFGKIKVSQGAGPAGHKGVKSIIDELRTKNFVRARIGIRPEGSKEKAENFVLKNFSRQEKQKLPAIFGETLELMARLLISPASGDFEAGLKIR